MRCYNSQPIEKREKKSMLKKQHGKLKQHALFYNQSFHQERQNPL